MNQPILTAHVQHFIKFLSSSNCLHLALAFVVSTNIQQLTLSFVTAIINPILKKVFQSTQDLTITILGIKFPIGPFVTNVITFIIVLYIFFLIFTVFRIDLKPSK